MSMFVLLFAMNIPETRDPATILTLPGPGTTLPALEPARFPGLPPGAEVMMELPGDGGSVLVGRLCDGVACEGFATVRQNGTLRKLKTLPKSKNGWREGGVMPYFGELRDVDGDGVRELVVAYTVVGPPRDGIGPYVKDWVAVLNVSDFELGLVETIGEHGVENEPACGANLYIVDYDGDQHNEITIERQCGRLKDLLEGKGVPEYVHYIWDAKADRYRRFTQTGISADLK
jgi:hypothetical protein